MPITTDVLIVGAGPTGLLLAGDLAARGVSCTVLEQRVKEAATTRAFAVHARTLEMLDARGVADELIGTGTPINELRLFRRLFVSMAGLPSRFPFLLVSPQYNVERLLQRRATSAGARIVRGVRFTGLTQDADRVEARFEPVGSEACGRNDDPEGVLDGETTCQASYLIGADGVHSSVREAVGLPFPGGALRGSLMIADVRLGVEPAFPVYASSAREGFAFIAPFGGGVHRVIAWDRRYQLPESEPVDPEVLRGIMRLTLGSDFEMGEVLWSSRFHAEERQVPDYRVGRVFLAGDAAHCHSPAGGMGMNTGLQDAANLGWKLIAAIDRRAPEGLLDTYQTERYPAGALARRASGRLARLATARSSRLRFVRDQLAPVALAVPPVHRFAAATISGVGVRYERPRGAHPSVGGRAGDVDLAWRNGIPTRLYEVLREGRFVVIGHGGDDEAGRLDLDAWKGRVEYARAVAERSGNAKAKAGGNAAKAEAAELRLVRPDGYVAWATDSHDPAAQRSALHTALTAWCGAPD